MREQYLLLVYRSLKGWPDSKFIKYQLYHHSQHICTRRNTYGLARHDGLYCTAECGRLVTQYSSMLAFSYNSNSATVSTNMSHFMGRLHWGYPSFLVQPTARRKIPVKQCGR